MNARYQKHDSSQESSLLIEKSENTIKKLKEFSASQEYSGFGWRWKDLGLLIVVLLLQGGAVCVESFLYPLLPEVALKIGLTQTYIGVVFSAYEVGRFLTSAAVGSLVSKTTPKIMLILGGALSSVSSFLIGLFYYVDDGLFFSLNVMARLISGCGMSMVTVSGLSLLLKATEFQTGTVLVIVEGILGCAYSFGVAAGIFLNDLVGYSFTCYIFGGFMGVLMIIQIAVVPNIEETGNKSSKGFFQLMKVPGQVLLFFHCFTNTLCMTSRLVSLPSFLMTTFGVSSSDIGSFLGVANFIYLLFSPLCGFLINKLTYTLILIAWLIQSLLLLFMGPSPLLDFIFHGKKYYLGTVITWCTIQLSQVCVFLAPFKASLNLAEATGYERDSVHTYGMIAGMVNCAQGLGSIAGPVGGGAIYEVLGFPWLVTIFGFLQFSLATVTIIYLITMRLANKPLTPEQADEIRFRK
ncbi:SLC18B1 [Bugula neritina]|uniref:SLC18B1 n=1 Tax=Bugula neritina TaxID=10212 RepID=A0A7J7JPR6_BUGNE|nr:SLC18B1 [Bugula neritina]